MTPPDPKANERPDLTCCHGVFPRTICVKCIWETGVFFADPNLRFMPERRDEPGDKYKKPFGRGDCRHDVYDVLAAFNVTCPAVAHAVKKLLCAGQRGHKDRLTDLQEAAVALTRAVELEGEVAK